MRVAVDAEGFYFWTISGPQGDNQMTTVPPCVAKWQASSAHIRRFHLGEAYGNPNKRIAGPRRILIDLLNGLVFNTPHNDVVPAER